ncbi:poly(ADP-ribose) glycohydrolase domain-containing protein [Fluoribacter gormanii]|uniref:poly(ADP-ribose) glycohydrolase domain-containing protein n=1 Tax=Fluoribacter gormanii TaxID=464 RepID=UPI0010416173|nr:poly(ADP-ribose) glycohydrolase domain-containing protein [Fluoribacter gormanii]
MKSLQELYQVPKSFHFSKIKKAYYSQKPGFIRGILSGELWRHQSLKLTLDCIFDSAQYEELQNQATNNLSLWEKTKIEPPKRVDVVNQDFGEAALEATKIYGSAYAVLNMASPLFPGGAFLQGGSAQEENLWHRTSCASSLLSEGVYYDEARKYFIYDEQLRKFLLAQEKMNDEELGFLSFERKEKIPEAYKVFIGNKTEIFFRGPEVSFPTDFDENIEKVRFTADKKLSYTLLSKEKIFPFYELRSAAPEIHGEIDFQDKELLEKYTLDLRHRISAQLDTLILNGKKNVILGAWGCGCFKNNPDLVAQIYLEEIDKRAANFNHIIFPIIDTEYQTKNLPIFKKYLDGLVLGRMDSKKDARQTLNPHGLFMKNGANSESTMKVETKSFGNFY